MFAKSKSSVPKNEVSSDPVFEDFHAHFSAPISDDEVVMIRSFQVRYPDHVCTMVEGESCDLLKFAKDGLAKANLVNDESSKSRTRGFVLSRKRLDSDEGHFKDWFNFAKYDYEFQGQRFIVYTMVWFKLQIMVHRTVILRPRDDAEIDEQGNSATIDALIAAATKHQQKIHEEVMVFDQGCWRKDSDLWHGVQRSSWDDVIIDNKIKKNLVDDVLGFFDSRSAYSSLGVPWKRGVILHGSPGNGKSMTLAALINSLSKRAEPVPAIYVKSFASSAGGEWSVGSIFSRARATAPCLLILEDLDTLVQPKVRSYFLNEVDGLETNDGIMIIGTTNNLENLDSSIAKRPSRFDRKYFFPLPAKKQREQYCEYWRAKLAASTNEVEFPAILCSAIADITEEFSFAYLKETFVATLLSIIYGRGGGGEEDVSEHMGISDADTHKELDHLVLWRVIKGQVETLRDDMGAGSSRDDVGSVESMRKYNIRYLRRSSSPKLSVP
ncbi:MAG: hypothetical protein M4579_000387 [Chaenotheca gracillima]|nr:MAG: hypothetical protein M4579_000387 [Chaenotheca gracillima]